LSLLKFQPSYNAYSDVVMCPDTLRTMRYTPQHYLFKPTLCEIYCVC